MAAGPWVDWIRRSLAEEQQPGVGLRRVVHELTAAGSSLHWPTEWPVHAQLHPASGHDAAGALGGGNSAKRWARAAKDQMAGWRRCRGAFERATAGSLRNLPGRESDLDAQLGIVQRRLVFSVSGCLSPLPGCSAGAVAAAIGFSFCGSGRKFNCRLFAQSLVSHSGL